MKLKEYQCNGVVVGGKYLGTVKAKTREEAIKKASQLSSAYVSLCHQCSDECENAEVTEIIVDCEGEDAAPVETELEKERTARIEAEKRVAELEAMLTPEAIAKGEEWRSLGLRNSYRSPQSRRDGEAVSDLPFPHNHPNQPIPVRTITVCQFCGVEVPEKHHATHWQGCEKHPARIAMTRVQLLLRAGSFQAAKDDVEALLR